MSIFGILSKNAAAKGEDRVRGGWADRFFELREEVLYYFSKRGDAIPKGHIPLRGAKISKADSKTGKLYTIRIQQAKPIFNYLLCRDKEEQDRWLNALMTAAGQYDSESQGNHQRSPTNRLSRISTVSALSRSACSLKQRVRKYTISVTSYIMEDLNAKKHVWYKLKVKGSGHQELPWSIDTRFRDQQQISNAIKSTFQETSILFPKRKGWLAATSKKLGFGKIGADATLRCQGLQKFWEEVLRVVQSYEDQTANSVQWVYEYLGVNDYERMLQIEIEERRNSSMATAPVLDRILPEQDIGINVMDMFTAPESTPQYARLVDPEMLRMTEIAISTRSVWFLNQFLPEVNRHTLVAAMKNVFNNRPEPLIPREHQEQIKKEGRFKSTIDERKSMDSVFIRFSPDCHATLKRLCDLCSCMCRHKSDFKFLAYIFVDGVFSPDPMERENGVKVLRNVMSYFDDMRRSELERIQNNEKKREDAESERLEIRAKLSKAIILKNVNMLESAIAEAVVCGMDKSEAALLCAQKVLDDLQSYYRALREAIIARSLEGVQDSMEIAGDLGVCGPIEAATEQFYDHLDDELKLLGELKVAIKIGRSGEVRKLVNKAKRFAIKTLVDTKTRKLLPELVETGAFLEHSIITKSTQWLAIEDKRDELSKTITKAERERNWGLLEKALCDTDEVVARKHWKASKLLKDYKRHKLELLEALESRDLDNLQNALKTAIRMGMDTEVVTLARRVHDNIKQEEDLNSKLKNSLDTKNIETLSFVVSACEEYRTLPVVDGKISLDQSRNPFQTSLLLQVAHELLRSEKKAPEKHKEQHSSPVRRMSYSREIVDLIESRGPVPLTPEEKETMTVSPIIEGNKADDAKGGNNPPTNDAIVAPTIAPGANTSGGQEGGANNNEDVPESKAPETVKEVIERKKISTPSTDLKSQGVAEPNKVSESPQSIPHSPIEAGNKSSYELKKEEVTAGMINSAVDPLEEKLKEEKEREKKRQEQAERIINDIHAFKMRRRKESMAVEEEEKRRQESEQARVQREREYMERVIRRKANQALISRDEGKMEAALLAAIESGVKTSLQDKVKTLLKNVKTEGKILQSLEKATAASDPSIVSKAIAEAKSFQSLVFVDEKLVLSSTITSEPLFQAAVERLEEMKKVKTKPDSSHSPVCYTPQLDTKEAKARYDEKIARYEASITKAMISRDINNIRKALTMGSALKQDGFLQKAALELKEHLEGEDALCRELEAALEKPEVRRIAGVINRIKKFKALKFQLGRLVHAPSIHFRGEMKFLNAKKLRKRLKMDDDIRIAIARGDLVTMQNFLQYNRLTADQEAEIKQRLIDISDFKKTTIKALKLRDTDMLDDVCQRIYELGVDNKMLKLQARLMLQNVTSEERIRFKAERALASPDLAEVVDSQRLLRSFERVVYEDSVLKSEEKGNRLTNILGKLDKLRVELQKRSDICRRLDDATNLQNGAMINLALDEATKHDMATDFSVRRATQVLKDIQTGTIEDKLPSEEEKRQIQARIDISTKMNTKILENDTDGISELLEACEKLDENGEMVLLGRRILEDLHAYQKERNLALKSRDVLLIQNICNKAADMALNGREEKAAISLQSHLDDQQRILDHLKRAIKTKSVTRITDALTQARAFEQMCPDEKLNLVPSGTKGVDLETEETAQSYREYLEARRDLIDRLTAATAKRDVKSLEKAISDAGKFQELALKEGKLTRKANIGLHDPMVGTARSALNNFSRTRMKSRKLKRRMKSLAFFWEAASKKNAFRGSDEALPQVANRVPPSSSVATLLKNNNSARANEWINEQIKLIVKTINKKGKKNKAGKRVIKFKKLLQAQRGGDSSMAGILKRAKIRGLIHYEGDILIKGMSDKVEIVLLS